MTENKYYETDVIYNEFFYKLKDFALDLLKKKILKEVKIGFSYHYCSLKGDIKVFWRFIKKRMNQPKLVFKTNDFEIETEHTDWDCINFKDNGIEIEGKRPYALYFIFKNPISKEYKDFLKSGEGRK
jgi:hypothetical protein